MALRIGKLFSGILLSSSLKGMRRGFRRTLRKVSGRNAEVLYFHQPDDPYSHLTAQVLSELQARYDINLQIYLVDEPADEMAPERA